MCLSFCVTRANTEVGQGELVASPGNSCRLSLDSKLGLLILNAAFPHSPQQPPNFLAIEQIFPRILFIGFCNSQLLGTSIAGAKGKFLKGLTSPYIKDKLHLYKSIEKSKPVNVL